MIITDHIIWAREPNISAIKKKRERARLCTLMSTLTTE